MGSWPSTPSRSSSGRSELGSWAAALADWGPRLATADLLHLWFLRDLLVYCLVLALVAAFPLQEPAARATDRVIGRLMAAPWLGVAAAVVAGVLVVVALAGWRLSGIGAVTGVLLTNQVLLYCRSSSQEPPWRYVPVGCASSLAGDSSRRRCSRPHAWRSSRRSSSGCSGPD